jgi:hypothetical protein
VPSAKLPPAPSAGSAQQPLPPQPPVVFAIGDEVRSVVDELDLIEVIGNNPGGGVPSRDPCNMSVTIQTALRIHRVISTEEVLVTIQADDLSEPTIYSVNPSKLWKVI